MEVVIGFSMLKSIQQNTHRRGKDMSKKSEHANVQRKKHAEKQRNLRKKTEERKRGQNCTLPGKNYQG